MHLSRDDFRADPTPATEDVPVPEWGSEGALVRVKTLSGRERGNLVAALMELNEEDRKANWALYWCAAAIVGADGKLVFGLDRRALDLLARQDGRALDRVVEVVDRLNAVSERALRRMEKNSPLTGNGSFGSSLATATAEPSMSVNETLTAGSSPN